MLAGTTVAYVHYPTISDDMVKSVTCGAIAPNNIKGGRSVLKLAYYHFICRPMCVQFIFLMRFCCNNVNMYFIGGQFVNLAMVNSKWTKAHVEKRWGGKAALVYPPVDVEKFSPLLPATNLQETDDSEAAQQQQQQQQHRDIPIISCAQFRPEKDHSLQIDILRQVHQRMREQGKQQSELPRLMVVGGAACSV